MTVITVLIMLIQTPVDVPLDSSITITFPGPPERIETDQFVGFKHEAASATLIAMQLLEPRVEIDDSDDLEKFYQGMISGLTKTSGAVLIDSSIYLYQGLLQMKAHVSFADGRLLSTQAVFLKSPYIFQVWSSNRDNDFLRLEKSFLASVKFSKKLTKNDQFNRMSKWEARGRLAGYALIVAVIVFVILKVRRRKPTT
jgi:hypothetical protein